MSRLVKLFKWAAVLLVVGFAGLLAIRVWQVERGPPLALWHTFSPDELRARDLAKLEWAGYLEAEKALFEQSAARKAAAAPAPR
jgi:hypothetical protein